MPVLLGGIYKLTGNSSPADYLKGVRNKPEYMALETERFIRRHGISTTLAGVASLTADHLLFI